MSSPKEPLQHPRTIKSFAIREGRLTPRQEQALEAEWARYVLPANELIDWANVFPSETNLPKPIILEIGFGMGHALLKNAQAQPDCCFIGIEVYRPGIGALLSELKTRQINNVRVFYGDAVEIFNHCVPNQSLDGVHIFFADPWPKRRHHKRRLIQTAFVNLIVQKLKAKGTLHLATDWEDYATHMIRVLSSIKELVPVDNTAHKKNRPLTKYEQRGKKLGHGVWDLVYERSSTTATA
jgi:tRNA (guanine-N7-)-methyltransferase